MPFGLFGIDAYLKAPVGGDTVATVGNARISQQEFDKALRRQAEHLPRSSSAATSTRR